MIQRYVLQAGRKQPWNWLHKSERTQGGGAQWTGKLLLHANHAAQTDLIRLQLPPKEADTELLPHGTLSEQYDELFHLALVYQQLFSCFYQQCIFF